MTNRRRQSRVLTEILSSITEEDRRRSRDRMIIAIKIADALEAKNLSQKTFAKLMGKSESEISEWLSGNRNFTVDTLSDISDCLGICLLTDSDMITKRICTKEVHRKVTKTRSPFPYTLTGNSCLGPIIGQWYTLDDFTGALV